MRSVATTQFWRLYDDLPEAVQRQADRAYALWQTNPAAHGLYFKRVGVQQPVYSVRIGRGYRALGLLEGDAVIWFWIGAHDQYERLLERL